MERSSKTLVALLTLAMGVGCNSLLGLDGYSGADAGTDGGNGGLDGAVDAAADVIVVEPPGVRPASWPKWIMPNEPDSGVANPADYGTAGTDVTIKVVGSTTGVLTFASTVGVASTFAAAIARCAPGYRLPTRIELVTLLDYRTNRSTVMPPGFSTLGGVVWTSSIRRPATNPTIHWFVNAANGTVVAAPAQEASVVCIVDVK